MITEKLSLYTLRLVLCGMILLFVIFCTHVLKYQSTSQWKVKANFLLNNNNGIGVSETGDTYTLKYHRNNLSEKYNVLLIIVDDIRSDMECFGGSQFKVYTPNINMLAKKSLVLRQAYTQYPTCGPSRTTIFTGRRPDTHGLYNNTAVSFSKPNFTDMFSYFKRHGYNTYSIGKTFHFSLNSPWLTARDTWSEPPQLPRGRKQTPYWNMTRHLWRSVLQEERKKHQLPDDYILEATLGRMRQVAKTDEPYFIAVGFVQTHTPILSLDNFKEHYPLENVTLSNNTEQIRYLPDMAKLRKHEFKCHAHNFLPTLANKSLAERRCREGQTLKSAVFRQAYMSAESFVDSNIGILLKELGLLKMKDNTIVALLADHSYMLGENSLWQKDILLDAASRVPLLIHIPGHTDQGIVSDSLVELVDVFPTLVQSAGLPTIPTCPKHGSIHIDICHEGVDFTPLIQNSSIQLKKAVFSQRSKPLGKTSKHIMGYSVRTEQYRFSEYIEYSTTASLKILKGRVHARELYDHTKETLEIYNSAKNSSYMPVIDELSKLIHDGWKAALPLQLGDVTQ